MIGQHFARHAGVSTMHRYAGLGFWDSALDFADDFASDWGADAVTDWGGDFASDWSADAVTDWGGDYAWDAGGDWGDGGADVIGDHAPFTPLEYDAQYQYHDAIDNFSGDYDAGAIQGEYIPNADDARYIEQDANAYGEIDESIPAPGGGWPSVPSMPSIPGTSTRPTTSGGGGGIVRTSAPAGASALDSLLRVTPSILDAAGRVIQRQGQIDNAQAQLDRIAALQQGGPSIMPQAYSSGVSVPGASLFDKVAQSIRENPMPYALGAGALALVLLSSRSSTAPRRRRRK